jgi:hypothetical protein
MKVHRGDIVLVNFPYSDQTGREVGAKMKQKGTMKYYPKDSCGLSHLTAILTSITSSDTVL